MTQRKQIMVSLSGNDLVKYQKIEIFLKERSIEPTASEIMKMTLRQYYDQIKKELEETLDEVVPQIKKEG